MEAKIKSLYIFKFYPGAARVNLQPAYHPLFCKQF